MLICKVLVRIWDNNQVWWYLFGNLVEMVIPDTIFIHMNTQNFLIARNLQL